MYFAINCCTGLFLLGGFTNNHPRGVLGISSDGDDRRMFLDLKFSILGFFWVRKFGKYFFG